MPHRKHRSRPEKASSPPASRRRRKAPKPVAPELSDEEAQELFDHYTVIVRQIVGGFQKRLPRNVLRDDLLAAGMAGLWDAVRKHGGDPGPNFEWYIRVRVRGAIVDELRAQDWVPRRARTALANEAGEGAPIVVRLDDVSTADQARCLTATTSVSAEDQVEAKMARRSLERAVEKLPDRERCIVSLHYFRGMKFKELGAMLGVSEPRVSQLHSRAMGRLRTILQAA